MEKLMRALAVLVVAGFLASGAFAETNSIPIGESAVPEMPVYNATAQAANEAAVALAAAADPAEPEDDDYITVPIDDDDSWWDEIVDEGMEDALDGLVDAWEDLLEEEEENPNPFGGDPADYNNDGVVTEEEQAQYDAEQEESEENPNPFDQPDSDGDSYSDPLEEEEGTDPDNVFDQPDIPDIEEEDDGTLDPGDDCTDPDAHDVGDPNDDDIIIDPDEYDPDAPIDV